MQEIQIKDYLGLYSLTLSSQFAVESHYLTYGIWEEHVLRCIDYFVAPGNRAIDVGANSGLLTIAMAHKVGVNGRVYAFEPSPLTYPRLVHNIEQNPSLKDRVQLEKSGLADKSGQLRLYHSGDLLGNAYMAEEFKSEYWNSGGEEDYTICPVRTIDEYFSDTAVHFLKIDVEGMELEVLTGGAKVIAHNLPIIIYETLLESFDHQKIRACEELLRSMGYLTFIIHPHQGTLVPGGYPNLGPDTLAIHSSQVMQFRHRMYDVALLETALAGLKLAK